MAARLRDASLRDKRSSSRGPDPDSLTQSKTIPSRDKPKKEPFMDKWLEPALNKTSSYHDHGGGALGVVEHMQPLGEAPSAKVKARVKADGARKSILNRSSAATGFDAQDTPEGSPAPTPQPSSQQPEPPVIIDDEKDDDYAPAMSKKERSKKPKAAKRKSEAAAPEADTTQAGKADTAKATKTAPATARVYDAEKLKVVVDVAVDRALAHNRPELADAVREIWRESLSNERLSALLEAILTQSATADQTAEFQHYVKAAKKRVKDNSRSAQANGTNGDSTPAPQTSSSSTKPSTTSAVMPSSEQVEPPRPKISLKLSKSPKKNDSPHKKKKRSDSMGSDSSLTSLTSHGEDAMDLDDENDYNTDSAAPGRSTRTNGIKPRDQAAERGSLAPGDRNLKRTSAEADFLDDEREKALAAKKRRLAEGINREYNPRDSDIRERGSRSSLRSSRLAPPTINTNPRTRSRAISEDLDSPLSELSAMSPQRGGTPQWKGPSKQKAKTKTSPEKKQSSGYSGIQAVRIVANGNGPGIVETDSELSDNNDFCSACGGSGFLLCCDGCDRSFHFGCLDPPISDKSTELNEPWFCYVCISDRAVPTQSAAMDKAATGIFAPLLNGISKQNPTNFALPQDIRDHFEGVATAKDGSFQEVVDSSRPQKGSRPGYTGKYDYCKLKDNKGNTIMCYSCSRTAFGGRPCVPCDYCPMYWHTDCLDPPLANPPATDADTGLKLQPWMCPLHTDRDLRNVDVSRLQAPAGRQVHLRKPRKPQTVDAAMTRGMPNNGVIDVVDDESESESEFYEEEDISGESTGRVYRMPASGIKLDFINKVKSGRIQNVHDEHISKRIRLADQREHVAPTPSVLQDANFQSRPIAQQKTALELIQFSAQTPDLHISEDAIVNLTGTLIAEAPARVVEELTAAEEAAKNKPQFLREAEDSLERMLKHQELVDRKIAALRHILAQNKDSPEPATETPGNPAEVARSPTPEAGPAPKDNDVAVNGDNTTPAADGDIDTPTES